jgi:hypothetical protein
MAESVCLLMAVCVYSYQLLPDQTLTSSSLIIPCVLASTEQRFFPRPKYTLTLKLRLKSQHGEDLSVFMFGFVLLRCSIVTYRSRTVPFGLGRSMSSFEVII